MNDSERIQPKGLHSRALSQILGDVNSVERAERTGQQEEAVGDDRHTHCLDPGQD